MNDCYVMNNIFFFQALPKCQQRQQLSWSQQQQQPVRSTAATTVTTAATATAVKQFRKNAIRIAKLDSPLREREQLSFNFIEVNIHSFIQHQCSQRTLINTDNLLSKTNGCLSNSKKFHRDYHLFSTFTLTFASTLKQKNTNI